MPEISDCPGVGPTTVQKIKDAGFPDFDSLKEASVEELTEGGLSEGKANDILKYVEMNSITLRSGTEYKDKRKSMKRITTGMPDLDEALGGGFLEETIAAVYGQSGAGKSQLIYKCLTSAVESTGKPAVLIETEANRYDHERIEELSSTPGVSDKIFHIRADNLSKQMTAYNKIRQEMDELSMIAIDSFNSNFRTGFSGRAELSERSTEMGEHMNELIHLTRHFSCPCLMATQVYSDPSMYGSGDVPYGGNIFEHEVNMLLRVRSGQGDWQTLELRNHASQPDQELHMGIGSNIEVQKEI